MTLYSGKVDLGTGLRIAFRADRGRGAGRCRREHHADRRRHRADARPGPHRRQYRHRRAAACRSARRPPPRARRCSTGAERLNAPRGRSRRRRRRGAPESRRRRRQLSPTLIGDRRFDLKVDPKAPLKDPQALHGRRQAAAASRHARPRSPAGTLYARFHAAGHAARPRDPAAGDRRRAGRRSTSRRSRHFRACASCASRISSASSAEDEWTARARRARAEGDSGAAAAACRPGRALTRSLDASGAVRARRRPWSRTATPAARRRRREAQLRATYYWPVQSHGSIGPSCAVADVQRRRARRSGPRRRAPTAFAATFAQVPRPAARQGAGHLSRRRGLLRHERPRRCRRRRGAAVAAPSASRCACNGCARTSTAGIPKGPPQLLDLRAALDADGRIVALGHRDVAAQGDAGPAACPLLGRPTPPASRRRTAWRRPASRRTAIRPIRCRHVEVTVHWLKDAPLRPSQHARARQDRQRLRGRELHRRTRRGGQARSGRVPPARLTDPRGIEVLKRAARAIGWQARRRRTPRPARRVVPGRGIAYVHYKHNETYVAMGMEVAVDRATGRDQGRSASSARMIAAWSSIPTRCKAQVEGNILQTLSRTLHEEVTFDQSRVTSVDWASYPILRFPEVPQARHRTDRPADRAAARRGRGGGDPGAGGAWPMRSSTRPACGCVPSRSRRTGSNRR